MEWNVEEAVRERYAEAAHDREQALCCAPDYDGRYLAALPTAIVERDYGCGDPSRWVGEGETALDLGSGSGKACYVMAQVVGPEGRVIGIDVNDEMLALSRAHRSTVAERIGWDVVEFRRGRIQDLRTDPDGGDGPLVADDAIDVVVSNCVLNLVPDDEKPGMFDEIHRVLVRGGRAVISDIVADRAVPDDLKKDPELWSGCVSGAMTGAGFLEAFSRAGFVEVDVLERAEEPWRTVEGIAFRSMTVRAWKGERGSARELDAGPSTGCCC